jgi:uncharacterized membrane protein HdeD (DUF308 family)
MQASIAGQEREVRQGLAGTWWLFLVTGILWTLIAFAVLPLDPGTVRLISYLVGFVVIFAGINELVAIAFVDSWKWAHGVFGAVFIIAGLMALVAPLQTFGYLALIIGWYLVFKGMFGVILSIAGRHEINLWGLLLASGIVEMLIGVWAIGSPLRSAWLLVIWIGLAALFRGITEIILAFRLRSERATA